MTSVTLPLEELANLVKHSSNSMYVYNLSRSRPGEYHRCLRVMVHEPGSNEVNVTFELSQNQTVVATVTHKLDDLFGLLPQLREFLELQGKGLDS